MKNSILSSGLLSLSLISGGVLANDTNIFESCTLSPDTLGSLVYKCDIVPGLQEITAKTILLNIAKRNKNSKKNKLEGEVIEVKNYGLISIIDNTTQDIVKTIFLCDTKKLKYLELQNSISEDQISKKILSTATDQIKKCSGEISPAEIIKNSYLEILEEKYTDQNFSTEDLEGVADSYLSTIDNTDTFLSNIIQKKLDTEKCKLEFSKDGKKIIFTAPDNKPVEISLPPENPTPKEVEKWWESNLVLFGGGIVGLLGIILLVLWLRRPRHNKG